jgi:Tfp pilus assembly protein PilN
MINLIPPAAKATLAREYWVRTSSVWLTLWGSALLLVSIMFIPVLVFISLQKEILADLVATGEKSSLEHELSTEQLLRANNQAILLLQNKSVFSIHESVAPLIRTITQSSIELTGIDLNQTVAPTLIIDGVARDRQTLATFRDNLEKNDMFENVTLPISSLVRDVDIPFTITIEISTTTPVL